MKRTKAPPVATIAPSGLKTWHTFTFLIVTAIALYYAKGPILVIAAIVGFVVAWSWFCRRYPRTAIFIFGFTRGLLGGGRRRRCCRGKGQNPRQQCTRLFQSQPGLPVFGRAGTGTTGCGPTRPPMFVRSGASGGRLSGVTKVRAGTSR
jgi:hypothetical protein